MTGSPPPHHPIGLVLSGGGARCFAQIGVLKAVEEEGLHVTAIAANSSASILGAIYATNPDAKELEAIVRNLDYSSFIELEGTTGLIGHEGIETLLVEHAVSNFEDLVIRLALTVVDIERAELLVLTEGPLGPAVCASNAFPGLFTPVEYLGRHLMDGGILDNFPVDVIRTLTRHPVLAVDVRPSPTKELDLEPDAPSSLVGKIGALFVRGVPATVDILMQAYNITQSRLVELTCALHPPDVWLRPALPDDLDIQDFSRFDEAFEIGYRSAKDAIAAGRFGILMPQDATRSAPRPRDA